MVAMTLAFLAEVSTIYTKSRWGISLGGGVVMRCGKDETGKSHGKFSEDERAIEG